MLHYYLINSHLFCLFFLEGPDEEIVEEVLDIKPRVKKLANQFNFCERAALTYVFPKRVSII